MTIKILDLIVEVEEVTSEDLLGNVGSSNWLKQTLKIDKSMSTEHKKNTMLHEILHLIISQLKVPILEGHEEQVICQLATGLLCTDCISITYDFEKKVSKKK